MGGYSTNTALYKYERAQVLLCNLTSSGNEREYTLLNLNVNVKKNNNSQMGTSYQN